MTVDKPEMEFEIGNFRKKSTGVINIKSCPNFKNPVLFYEMVRLFFTLLPAAFAVSRQHWGIDKYFTLVYFLVLILSKAKRNDLHTWKNVLSNFPTNEIRKSRMQQLLSIIN